MSDDFDVNAAAGETSDPVHAASIAHPGLPVLVFDGDCGFCTTSARWLQRRLHLEHVEPWQDLDLRALGLTTQECEHAVQFVRGDGRVFAGEMAFAALLIERGGLWRGVGRLMHAPGVRQLSGVVYRWIARNRHRLPGSTAACRIQR